jgi:Mg/Co/Ni transporter MgtE
MEPDEAVDALRDLSDEEQSVLLARMPQQVQRELVRLLGYPGDQAAGIMTTVLACASPDETVAQVSQRLAEQTVHRTEIDSVAVLDKEGRLLGDISAFDLLVSDGARRLGDLMDPDNTLTLRPEDDLDTVATELVESRRSSLLVVDDDGRPLGRILSDDVLDALVPGHGRLHFPRLLQ